MGGWNSKSAQFIQKKKKEEESFQLKNMRAKVNPLLLAISILKKINQLKS